MPARRSVCFFALLALAVVPSLEAQASQVLPRQLTLSQALDLAKRNSPTYRQTLNNADPAAAQVRQAKYALFPTFDLGSGLGYTGAGSSTFGGTTFNQSSPTLSSNYSLNAALQISAPVFEGPRIAKAQERAATENINAAAVSLVSDVTTQYLTVLRAAATVGVALEQVARDSAFLVQATARFTVQAAGQLDVLQAQTTKANADVALLQARQAESVAKMELVRRMGLPARADIDSLQLTEQFPLVEPAFDLETLRTEAHQVNPTIRSLVAQDDAAAGTLKAAHLAYYPTFTISTGLSAFTQQFTNENVLISNAFGSAEGVAQNCLFQNGIVSRLATPFPGALIPDCNVYAGLNSTGTALDPTVVQAIQSRNSTFPFNFSRQPWSIRLSIDLPIWDGYSRALRSSQARAQSANAGESLRAAQLQMDEQIQAQLLAVRTAWSATRIQDANRGTARQQLTLAQQRYSIGSASALDVADAQNAVTQAEASYVTAVYDFHIAVAGLEAAVGRPLR